MTKLNSIAVFCGSQCGTNPLHKKAVQQLASCFAKRSLSLVYGGASVGLMGILADEMLAQNCTVIGVMPEFLNEGERLHQGLSTFYSVESMADRKDMMNELSDGFMLLPGGAGSLDEFFEMFTAFQLGAHQKPCAILNVDGYYDSLLEFLEKSVSQGFVKKEHYEAILVSSEPEALLTAME